MTRPARPNRPGEVAKPRPAAPTYDASDDSTFADEGAILTGSNAGGPRTATLGEATARSSYGPGSYSGLDEEGYGEYETYGTGSTADSEGEAVLPSTLPDLEREGATQEAPAYNLAQLLHLYRNSEQVQILHKALKQSTPESPATLQAKGMVGSQGAIILSTLATMDDAKSYIAILPEREAAAYFYNDVQACLPGRAVLHFGHALRKPYPHADAGEEFDASQVLLRTDALQEMGGKRKRGAILVTYPEALLERVVNRISIAQNTFELKKNEKLELDNLTDVLHDFGFERTDFVSEPGQYAVRGGLVDVWSFAGELPYRIEFFGKTIDSMRSFSPDTQLSVSRLEHLTLLPNMQTDLLKEERESLLSYLSQDVTVWCPDVAFVLDVVDRGFWEAKEAYRLRMDYIAAQADRGGAAKARPKSQAARAEADAQAVTYDVAPPPPPEELYDDAERLRAALERHPIIEAGSQNFYNHPPEDVAQFISVPQPSLRKDFALLAQTIKGQAEAGIATLIFSEQPKQVERLRSIFFEIDPKVAFTPIYHSLHEGFICRLTKLACFTDHQIFERYHKYKLRNYKQTAQALTLKDLRELKPGDFVTHIDHGVGVFGGLEKIDVAGRQQEAVRLIYRDNDLLYVGINSLHKIAKYTGKEGTAPKVNKLGSDAWEKLKRKTKSKVKDIAAELIALYAKRKAVQGFAFAPDGYLQNELEASFIYEDTPDQAKATADVKADMTKPYPMDRLVCGDVGFGKTEIAVRAAFKAATDGKQAAILVPTTILALQHYKTFKDRLKDFPVRVDYLSRFRTTKERKDLLKDLEEGKIEIVIGTQSLISKDVRFKDLGILIIDEEQKFGVAVKEKLKTLRAAVDTLTLTATPIPRTLHFSLLGARDLSVINTPPPNRQPIHTELLVWNDERLREAIAFELDRGGQVFFVHNRVSNIKEVAELVRRLVPGARVAIGHGQMEGDALEHVLLEFIDHQHDVLVATNIIESGLDIPNANTIFINQAHNFGLSDLHQMRGRVGRSNRKAFCYLVVPPLSLLTPEARKRLKAIEEFSDLGAGFNVALRDLDIRGAGNLLGGEQSGFITEIGLELYHKILDEAVQELKETEFKDLFADVPPPPFVSECTIETDWAAHLPDAYVSSISERLNLYMQLDRIETEEGLGRFETALRDRFGPLPPEATALLGVVRIRRTAKALGIEKLMLKNGKARAYFTTRRQDEFFATEGFGRIITWVQSHASRARIKQAKGTALLEVDEVPTAEATLAMLRGMGGLGTQE